MQSGGWGVSFGARNRGPGTMYPGEKFQEWTTWTALFLIIFPFMCHSQTSLQIIDSPSPVEAILGENVTIPCVLTDPKQPQKVLDLNLHTDSVRWEKKSLNGSIERVHLFTGGKSTYNIQRSNIEEKEFKRGIASLVLYDVQKSDEGEYICNMYVAGNKLLAARTLEVSARPVVTLSSYNVTIVLGNEQSVTCFIRKFYPESVKIRWEKCSVSSEKSALDRETCTSVPTVAEDGTFNVTSLMTVKPSDLHENGDTYSCIVSHRSLKSERAAQFTVTVKEITEPPSNIGLFLGIPIGLIIVVVAVVGYFLCFKKRPPKISDIIGIDTLEHGKSSTLSWTVSDFRPKNIIINAYLKRGDINQKIKSWSYLPPKSQHSDNVDGERGEGFRLLPQQNAMESLSPKRSFFAYSCLCSTSITPDKTKDKNAELVIEVTHDALKSKLTKLQNLTIQGDHFACKIISQQPLKHGEETTLTCDITKCERGPLSITWLKGKDVICEAGIIKDTRYSHAETSDEPYEGNMLISSSSLTFRAQYKEDHGAKYICRVYYPEINKILAPHLDTSVTARPVVEQISSSHIGQKMQLSCKIHSFYPETINIKWLKDNEELSPNVVEPSRMEDLLYSTTSTVTFTPELEDIVKIFRCQVDHQSLKKLEIREWKLEEHRGSGIKNMGDQ